MSDRDITGKKLERERAARIKLESMVEDRTRELYTLNEQTGREKNIVQQYLDVAGTMLVALELDGTIIMVNARACELLEGDRETLIGMNWFDHFIPDGQEDDLRSVFEMLAGEEIEPVEYNENEIVSLNGNIRTIRWHNAVLKDENGTITGILGSGDDITQEREMFLALRDSELRFRTLFENSLDAIYFSTESGALIRFNMAFVKMFGYSEDELASMTVFDFYRNPADREDFIREIEKTGRIKDLVLTLKQKDGTLLFCQETALMLPDGEGKEKIYQGIIRDVSSRIQFEEALKLALEETKQKNREVESLLTSARAVLQKEKFDEAARAIFDECKNATGATAGYVALLNDSGEENEVLFLDAGGLPCDVDPDLPMPIRGLREVSYRTRSAVYDNDFSAGEWMHFMPEGHVELRNVLFAPLIIDDTVVGLLGLANKDGDFTEHDRKLAEAFGELAAVALKNTRARELLAQSEERFRGIFDESPIAIEIYNADGSLLHLNKACLKMFGVSDPESLKKFNLFDDPNITPDQMKLIRSSFATMAYETQFDFDKVIETGLYETSRRGKMHISVLITPFDVSGDGHPDGYLMQLQDKTEEKQYEKRIRLEKAYFEELFESSPEAIVLVDNNGVILKVNREFVQMFGYEKQEAVGAPLDDLVSTDELREEANNITRSMASGETVGLETRRMRKDGTLIDVAVLGNPIRTQLGQDAVLAIYRDISDRKRYERLAAARQRISGSVVSVQSLNELYPIIHKALSTVIDTTNIYIAVYDKDADILSYTYLVDEKDNTLPDIRVSSSKSSASRVVLTGKPFLRTEEIAAEMQARGELKQVGPAAKVWLGVPLKTDNEVAGVLVVQSYDDPKRFSEKDTPLLEYFADTIAAAIMRKRSDDALREAEERWNFAIQGSGDGVFDWNMTANRVFYSKRWKEMIGFQEREIGNSPEEWSGRVHPEDMPGTMEALNRHFSGEASEFKSEFRIRCKDGSYKWIFARGMVTERATDGTPLRIVGTHTDFSERKKLEEARAQSEKLETVQNMIVTMNHKMNQPLSVILSQASLLAREAADGSRMQEDLAIVIDETKKMTALLKKIARLRMLKTTDYSENTKMFDLSTDIS